MTIDEFIEIVYPKLKQDVKKTTELISGSDLLLSGQKEINDEKIIPNRMYEMEVPVIIRQDHKRKLQLAFLRGGKLGVRSYLHKWLDPKVLNTVMSVLE
jgi:hypothetical protein